MLYGWSMLVRWLLFLVTAMKAWHQRSCFLCNRNNYHYVDAWAWGKLQNKFIASRSLRSVFSNTTSLHKTSLLIWSSLECPSYCTNLGSKRSELCTRTHLLALLFIMACSTCSWFVTWATKLQSLHFTCLVVADLCLPFFWNSTCASD